MATEAGELVVKLTTDSSDLVSGIKNANDKIKEFSRNFVSNYGAVIASTAAAGVAVISFGISAVKSYAEQELAVKRLSLAVGVNAAKSLSDYAEQLQKTTTYSNESIVSLESQLANYGIYSGSVKEATKAVLDFAARTGKDLPDAGAMLGQALGGQARELKRFGLEVSSTATRSENLAKTIEFLQGRYHGAAEEIKNTTIGQFENLINRMDDLKKKIGEELIPVFTTWAGWLEKSVVWPRKTVTLSIR